MVNPFDYAANKESSTSMAHVATIVAKERAAEPDLLLIDTGDSIRPELHPGIPQGGRPPHDRGHERPGL